MWGAKDLSERLVNYFETGSKFRSFQEKFWDVLMLGRFEESSIKFKVNVLSFKFLYKTSVIV